ncbi:MAG: RNA polymerase sigma-70 factor [Sphingobacterium sp.]|jgi:RNA polymerase sigma-70 factor (ECF subfamily)|nr:RNA polymerase sigma-70 factor [Sphingobacterium sp.]
MHPKEKKELFTLLYDSHWMKLYLHSYKMIGDKDEARDIVQEVFTNLWDILDQVTITHSYSSYLYRAIRNVVINRISQNKLNDKFTDYSITANALNSVITPEEALREKDFAYLIQQEIDNLPKKMAEIFKKSRFQNQSYKEIAEDLSISENTVRKQIHNALVILRKKLKYIFILFYH